MGAVQGDPIDLLMGIGTHKPLRILIFYENECVFLKKNTSTFRGHVNILLFELQSLYKKLSIQRFQYLASSMRYWMASAMAGALISASPRRSAMVRATLMSRV